MDALIAKRKLLKGKLSRMKNKVDHESAQYWDIDTANNYDEKLSELWNNFNTLYDDILAVCPPEEEDAHQAQYDEIADRFDEVQVAVKHILRNLRGPEYVNQRRQSREPIRNEATAKLPKLDIPTFSGDILEWTVFSDLFTASVHNNTTLQGAQKLQYLKHSVKGKAAEAIASFQISDANYAEAWATLKKRYHNTRELIKTHLNRFLEMPSMKQESGIELRVVVDTATSVVRSLKALQRPINDDSDLAMHIIVNRIDSETHKLWETKIGRDNLPTLTELLEFLDDRATILTSSEFGKTKIIKQPSQGGVSSIHTKKTATAHQASADNSCVICQTGIHQIYACKKFTDMAVADRREKVKQLSLCFNCLRTGHVSQKCTSKNTCRECQRKHHTLLHIVQETIAAAASTTTGTVSAHTSTHQGDAKRALLSTVQVVIQDAFGQRQVFRALVDPGADVSFVTERCIQQLGVKKTRTQTNLSGLGAGTIGTASGLVQLIIGSRYDDDWKMNIDAYVLKKVTGILPRTPCEAKEISHLQNLQLADPSFNNPSNNDLLLGADVFFHTLKSGHINVGDDRPVALETVFGWIVGGICPSQNFTSASVNHVRCEDKIEEIIERFWQLEEIPSKTIMTREEKACENIFTSTTTRDATGRFVVELPFRDGNFKLGASRDIAVRRLKQMERTLQSKPERKQQYIDFMKEYETLGHMELVPGEDVSKPDCQTYYLPHHAIIKDSSTTTKLRVVFDASSKTSSGLSLNDVLFTGPKLQDDLFIILIRFRMYIIAFTADICKMFRQIWIAEKHRDFQRIVWRESPEMPIRDYRLTTVTYGTSSAPYLSKRCLQQLATDGSMDYQRGSEVLARDFYMDDLMSGHFEINAALELQNQILKLMESSHLELRKWSSNNEKLLSSLDPKMRETQLPLRLDEDDVIKTLGLYWSPSSDHFCFKVSIPVSRKIVTKRTISSDMAKIFDPLGFLGPVTIVTKILLHQLWSQKLDWDEAVPDSILEKWLDYQNSLPVLQEIKINRCIKPNQNGGYELFGFSDASETAIGAVVYLRCKLKDGSYSINLVAAKTKVAPLKQVSLPRLELNGAVMLVRLMDTISSSFLTKPDAFHAFTDSTIVLAWLASHPKKWQTYVANRVSAIQEIIPYEYWHHVSGLENPADCASRGISPSDLVKHTLWWNGTNWLQDSNYTFDTFSGHDVEASVEERKVVMVHHVTSDLSLLNNFSSLSRLKRVTAYCLRFIANCRVGRKNKNASFISAHELHIALMLWVKLTQQNHFASEILSCIDKKLVDVKSHLRSLNPFIDDQGILRVGGRLRHSKLPIGRRFPIILPKQHILTSLIIRYEHLNNLHGGVQLVLNSIQRLFWIVNGRDAVRREIKKCVTCSRFKVEAATQMMSDLPSARVNPNPVFYKTGVDFTGPYALRITKGRSNRNYKGYIALFVCIVTRAVHLEVVTSLSSQAFIATLKRFIARRRVPRAIFSDNGRTFVGANREILKLWKSSEFNTTVGSYLAGRGTTWHFNPPSSPHFGGIWEAGIKSVKFHLQRSLGTSILTYEDMSTVIAQIEACLNSRPLTPMSSDPNDLCCLTPGHFLTGDALTALPEQDLTAEPISQLSKWKLMQRMVQQFWVRWSTEYLCKLQQRPKWLSQRPTLQNGDLVILKDERFPPMKWKLARIVQSHPGADGLTRVYTIKTADGIFKRPLIKLCPLPIDPSTSQ